jgi:hypothetical protein
MDDELDLDFDSGTTESRPLLRMEVESVATRNAKHADWIQKEFEKTRQEYHRTLNYLVGCVPHPFDYSESDSDSIGAVFEAQKRLGSTGGVDGSKGLGLNFKWKPRVVFKRLLG